MTLTRAEREFAVNVYGDFTKYNDVLSKVRCRIFYKGANRNGTYITDEFAEQLIASLPYTPMKGIFENGEFQGHGANNAEGKIYGIVPENANFAWEMHLDKDGIEREYACCDVLVFSELYAEANAVAEKGQSMELFPKTLKWHREVRDGQSLVVFDSGCFFGLQVLGNDYEPCFEGASFFTLRDNIEKAMFELEKIYELENKPMNVNFNRPSFADRASAIFGLLNPNFCEEGGWTLDYSILDVWEDYALVVKCEDGKYFRAYYTCEEDVITMSTLEPRHMIDLSDNEYDVVEKLREFNGGNYEVIAPEIESARDNSEKIQGFERKVAEMEETISSINLEKENFINQVASLDETCDALRQEKGELQKCVETYEAEIAKYEDKAKDAVIAQYDKLLPADVIEEFCANKSNYKDAVELDMHLAYSLKTHNIGYYDKPLPQYLPKENASKTGIEAILSKYPKN